MLLTGAQIIIQSLLDMGVDTVFGYPGGAVLHIYDAIYDKQNELRHVITSHEQGAVHAADGYARSTGKTGVVIATSGPGATNLVTGIATAYHDSVPLVAITGNVTWDLIGRDSFQEVDIVGITAPVTKYSYLVKTADSLAHIIQEAFTIANSGRKGPVLIDIPKDVTAQTAQYTKRTGFAPKAVPAPQQEQLQRVKDAILAAERPLIYCGGGVTFSDSGPLLQRFAKQIEAPVCLSMMGLTSVPADFPLQLGLIGMHGTPAANYAVSACDLLLTIGARFSDRVAGNRGGFAQQATVIHMDIDAAEISKNIPADIPLVGDVGDCLSALLDMLGQQKHPQWLHTVLQHKALNALPDPQCEPDTLSPRAVLTQLANVVGEDAIIATDVGQHQMFVAQHYPFQKPRTFLSSCGLGTMGYGLGAANGAAVAYPHRQVVLVTGDGSFHMNMAELAVSVSNRLQVLILIMNNHVLGMVHQWQSLFHKGRYSFTEIERKTDYVELAKAFGASGMRVTKARDLPAVLSAAAACEGPCVVDCEIPYHERVFPIVPPGGNLTNMIFTENET